MADKQYLQLLKDILEKGTFKPAAREGMPGTKSLFGYQMRFDLSEGFPLITTKKMFWKGVVIELLWFLKGDTHIKFLIDRGVNIWNEDSYNYYKKIASKNSTQEANKIYMPVSFSANLRSLNLTEKSIDSYSMFTFEEFCEVIKNHSLEELKDNFSFNDYVLGDCGKQYGWLWRNWEGTEKHKYHEEHIFGTIHVVKHIDQIKELLLGLKESPLGRRHIVTAWNPSTLDDMALNACHSMVQFNCRPLTQEERVDYFVDSYEGDIIGEVTDNELKFIPKYYLDCQLYQRSADTILGVPFNIASYSLLTHIIAKLLNMIPGDFVHTFGDVHIYENHFEAAKEQLQREPKDLPKVNINTEFWVKDSKDLSVEGFLENIKDKDSINSLTKDIELINYYPHSKLESETKLSTGLK